MAALAAASCILEIREAKAEAGLSEHDGIYMVHIITQHGATPESTNVRFHLTAADAEAAGFRPCRRCRPDSAPLSERYAAKVTEPCRLIEGADAPPTLAELAKTAGLSVFHSHHVFKSIAGVTPEDYVAALGPERFAASFRGARR